MFDLKVKLHSLYKRLKKLYKKWDDKEISVVIQEIKHLEEIWSDEEI